MEYIDLVSSWNQYASAIKRIGGDVDLVSIKKPASEKEVLIVETEIGVKLPRSLRESFIEFSREFEFRWFFPDGYKLEGNLSGIFGGELDCSLDWLLRLNMTMADWRDSLFPNKEDPYDVIWHDKLAIQAVGNGDYLAIDLSQTGKEPVVYLSHDDSPGHGVELAKNFKHYLHVSSRLGCVGAEDWQWLPFVETDQPYINPDCDNGIKFRKYLGVNV